MWRSSVLWLVQMTGPVIEPYFRWWLVAFKEMPGDRRMQRRCGSSPAAGCYESTQEVRSLFKSQRFSCAPPLAPEGPAERQ